MCPHRNKNICDITNLNCPWSYWCGVISNYKERDSCKKYCKFLKEEEEKQIPVGYYKVKFSRHGYLYIDFKGTTIKVKNPFEDVPKFVKVKKTKTSFKLEK